MNKKKRFETMLIHKGYSSQDFHGSLNPPIFHSSTFTFSGAEQGEKRFAGEEEGFIYSRLGNPTVRVLEERMAALEKGEAALAFGSGMAAVSAVLFHFLYSGCHILCSRGVYGCTFGLLDLLHKKFGVTHTFSPMQTAEEIEVAIHDLTCCIYIETPINPTMELIDIRLVTDVAKKTEFPLLSIILFAHHICKIRLSLGLIMSSIVQRNILADTGM